MAGGAGPLWYGGTDADLSRYANVADLSFTKIRGGSWHDRPKRCRSASRNHLPAWLGAYDVGFRVIAEAKGLR
jgi:formylglycine-generating enzyme required for sulfatase activity